MVGRRGVSIMEVIIASLLIGACLAPMLAQISRQSQQARWGRDRLIAEQLASDVLEHLQERGYTWMLSTGDLNGAGAVGLNRDYGYGLGNGYNPTGQRLQMHTITGAMNWTDPIFGWHRAPNAFNPALSGPGLGDPNAIAAMDLGLDIDGVAVTTARNTFATKYQFNREVEIWGGASYTPPGLTGAGLANCFMVRVTVWTPQGTMKAPAFPGDSDGRYQVVTIIGSQ